MTDRDRIRGLVQAFNPYQELHPGDTRYVNCAHERGTDHQLGQMERLIRYGGATTCQIFGGHRGGGKTTELLRLRQRLSDGDANVILTRPRGGQLFCMSAEWSFPMCCWR